MHKKGIAITLLVELVLALVVISILIFGFTQATKPGISFFTMMSCVTQDIDGDSVADIREDLFAGIPHLGGDGCPCDTPDKVKGLIIKGGCPTPRSICDARRYKMCLTGEAPDPSDCSVYTQVEADKFCTKHPGEPCGKSSKSGICNYCAQCVSLCEYLSSDVNKQTDLVKQVFTGTNQKYQMDTDFLCVCDADDQGPFLHKITEPPEGYNIKGKNILMCDVGFRVGPRLPSNAILPIGDAKENNQCCGMESYTHYYAEKTKDKLAQTQGDCIEKVKENMKSQTKLNIHDIPCVKRLFEDCANAGEKSRQYCGSAYLFLLGIVKSYSGQVTFYSTYNKEEGKGTTNIIFPTNAFLTFPVTSCLMQQFAGDQKIKYWVDKDFKDGLTLIVKTEDGVEGIYIQRSVKSDRPLAGLSYRFGRHPDRPGFPTSCLTLEYLGSLWEEYWGGFSLNPFS